MNPDWFVAIGTLALATITAWSVLRSGAQLKIERQRLEGSQWPSIIPTPSDAWLNSTGEYEGEASALVVPVTNTGPGTALAVGGKMTFPGRGWVHFAPTNLPAGHPTDLRLQWPPRETGGPNAEGPVLNWNGVFGEISYGDVAGAKWLTNFRVEVGYLLGDRQIPFVETVLVQRADGTKLDPTEKDSSAWYTPTPSRFQKVSKPGWLQLPKLIWTK